MTLPVFRHGTGGTVLAGIRLLSRRERWIAAVLALVIAVVEVMQLVGMLLVVPVVSLLIDESSFTRSRHIVALAGWLGNPPFDLFVQMLAGAALLLIILAHLGTFAVQSATEIFAARFQTRLMGEVLTECVNAPYAWFLDRNAAALVRLFHNDFSIWGREFIGSVLLIFSNLVTIAGGMTVILVVAMGQGLLAIAVVGAVAWVTLRVVRRGLTYWTSEKRKAAEKSSVALTEMLAGIKDVVTSGAWRYFARACAIRYGSMSRASARAVIYGAFPAAVLTLLAQVSLLLVLLVLWYGGVRGGALAAQMALIMLVVSRVIPSLSRLTAVTTRIVNAIPWVGGILDLRSSIAHAHQDAAISAKSSLPPQWSRLRFEDLSFAYSTRTGTVLDALTITWRRTGCYGLIGASGTGKTTFVDLLLGLLQPTRGHIVVDDVVLSEMDVSTWRKRIGYVSQSPYFVDDTLRANIVFGGALDAAWLTKCVEMAGLREFVTALPQGLDTVLGDRAVMISGGQKQRIAIARALYRKPDILVMDEATSALDAATEKLIGETLAELKSTIMIVIVSHRESALTICDEIFTFAGGRLLPVDAGVSALV